MTITDPLTVPQALHERLNTLERTRLADMDTRIQHAIEAPLSQVPLIIFTHPPIPPHSPSTLHRRCSLGDFLRVQQIQSAGLARVIAQS